mgnify:CR=1 FL=1
MNTILTLCLAVVGSSGVASVVVALLQHHWAKKEKSDARIDALVTAQQVMMIDRVRYLGGRYIKDGKISVADKENIFAMYEAYKALGGNGHLKTIMDEVDRLDVTAP